ncbi:MAG: 2'-5' RNA ligase family protein [Cyclobacteriaceae bacterium]|nr:2'-5' RNA ligase family protein [Cyclobacteriaceae bacterium]
MDFNERLYFIAVVPPPDIGDEIMALKRYFSEKYRSHQALRSPPHITLHMPFRWKAKNDEKLFSNLEGVAGTLMAFDIGVKDFGCFEPRVVFMGVEPSPLLQSLHGEVQSAMRKMQVFNAAYKEQAFHPHLTLAFRDLKKPMFYQAWEEFREKEIRYRFRAEGVDLLRHDGKIWHPFRRFFFGANVG